MENSRDENPTQFTNADLERLKADRDYEIRKQELKIRADELYLKREELKKTRWQNPILVSLLAGLLTLAGSSAHDKWQESNLRKTEHEKNIVQIMLAAQSENDPVKMREMLLLASQMGVIDVQPARIKGFVASKSSDDETLPHLPPLVAELLGESYWMEGRGVTKDYKKAMKAFQMAADQGNARAEANIGWMYELGLGIPSNCSEAMNWYRKAVQDGDAIANFNIGRLYGGECSTFPRDPNQAKQWYEKAAALGVSGAAEALKKF
ncbi:MAG: tetratricopeptide repeat protein [Candidatus Angelobacter sp.]